jgi:D-amino-acid dehydrogenase
VKVAVLGGGVIGVTTAYYLQSEGHEVVVFDRQPAPGLETSYANAGQVSWGYAAPWAAPGIPLKAVRWLFERHAPLVLRPRWDPALWRWLASMLRHCTASHYEMSKHRMLRLARYSQASLAQLRRDVGIRYDDRQRGTLQLFRTPRAMDRAAADMEVLRQFQVPHALLTREQCLAVEPGLRRAAEKIAGGLHLPADETGDCHEFTWCLASLAERSGVTFEMGRTVQRLEAEGDRIAGVVVDGRRETADAYVVALGSYSPELLAPLGIRLPVYPVKGYSATIGIEDPEAAPVSTVMDEAHKVAVTRLGDRIRAAGIAELAGFDLGLHPERCRTIRHVVEDLFPQVGPISEMRYWAGLRPMTPDGPPILGPTPYRNLHLNTGHGTLGWTMACGSGRVVADFVSGRESVIQTADLTLERYGAAAGDRARMGVWCATVASMRPKIDARRASRDVRS